jgi:hypothetical protein
VNDEKNIIVIGCGGEKKDAKTSKTTGNSMIIAEGPLTLPEDSNTEASGHNKEGIFHMMWLLSIS